MTPGLQGQPAALDKIYVKSPTTEGSRYRSAPSSNGRSLPRKLLSISHQGQFPAVTLWFNLAPGVALGQAVTAIQKAEAQLGVPASLGRHVPG